VSRWKEWKIAPLHVHGSTEYFISPGCDWMDLFSFGRLENSLSLPNGMNE